MSAIFAIAQVDGEWGIANCTYAGWEDRIPAACATAMRDGP